MDVKIEALKLLKQLFTKQNFADAKLMDGTIVSAEAFEPGKELFIIDESGEKLIAPEGPHTLEDGKIVTVKEGKIESIVEAESESDDIFDIESKMGVEVEIEPYVEEVPEKEEIAILKSMVQDLMEKVKIVEEEMGKIKMATEEADKTIADAVVELSENFSKIPAGNKLEVNPQEFTSKFNKITKKDKKADIYEWISKNKK